MTGDAGLQVHAHSYFEVEDKKTGEVIIFNWKYHLESCCVVICKYAI